MALQLVRRRFSVAEYHQMASAGILHEDDRVELIDGEVFQMTPIGSRHAGTVLRCNMLFTRVFADVAMVNPQNPVLIGEYSEPQPDLALVRQRPDFYVAGHPVPEDVLLLVEIADGSVEFDRRVKVPLYARGGIPEVWLVDLEQNTITVYRDLSADGYRTARVLRRGDHLALAAFPDRLLAVADILG
ncbi:MAG: Uma2 family endonuclease [Chloroflexi bacterium]|nr:Uma2 family endonuclease [Chloroflexota bacterium]